MMTGRVSWVALWSGILAVGGVARAEPEQLLATMNAGVVVGTPSAFDWHWPVLYYLDDRNGSLLFDAVELPAIYPVVVNDELLLGDNPSFSLFGTYLTNGIDQEVISGAFDAKQGLVGGGGGLESNELHIVVPRYGVDLLGYVVTRIERELLVSLESPGADPFGDGQWTDWRVMGTYRFYGMPIPEVGSGLLLLIGVVSLMVRRRAIPVMAEQVHHCAFGFVLTGTLLVTQAVSVSTAVAQCATAGSIQRDGLKGSDNNPHDFPNRCLAASGTNVTITIEAMADLGCNAFDAARNPPVGSQCPNSCTPICCDTAPTDKYVTATANSHSLDPSISGSTNMPTNGQFFKTWNTDCYTSSQACLEAGRSPCFGNTLAPNRHVVTIPAATWNSWLGASGSTMTIRVMTSAAVTSAPIEERSLALYCENLGFHFCQGQSCQGLCGPETFSRVSISYAQCTSAAQCNDSNPCTTDSCVSGQCQHTNNSSACNDGVFCNGADTCSGGSCSVHAGNPCVAQGLACDESTDSCVCGGGTISDSTPPDGTIDARQPHPVADCSLGARQGIGSAAEPIVITLSESGANHLDCWALCETGVEAVDTGQGCSELDDNAIAGVTETSTGVYEIVLDRPISAGYWTQITYIGDDSSVWYASLPGDANGSRGSTAADVTALIDYINQAALPPHGIYSTDIDHSGALAAADITRLIDLLNGAQTFIVWLNKSIPAYHPTCGGESLGGGGSEEEDDPEAFAAFLITYVATADPQGEAATALFDSLADALAGWVVQHFTGAQQAPLVEALSDAELSFASETGAAKAAEIVERLSE